MKSLKPQYQIHPFPAHGCRRRGGAGELPGCEVEISESIKGARGAGAHRNIWPLLGGHLVLFFLEQPQLFHAHLEWSA